MNACVQYLHSLTRILNGFGVQRQCFAGFQYLVDDDDDDDVKIYAYAVRLKYHKYDHLTCGLAILMNLFAL